MKMSFIEAAGIPWPRSTRNAYSWREHAGRQQATDVASSCHLVVDNDSKRG